MRGEPEATNYHPDPEIEALASWADPVKAASFPQHTLRFRNDRWAAAIGLSDLDDEQWIARVGRLELEKINHIRLTEDGLVASIAPLVH